MGLINKHFETRKKDDEELKDLEVRIETRKAERQEQMRVRQEREKERLQREKEEKARREAEEEAKRKEDEERKKAAIASMGQIGGNAGRDRNRNNRRQTDREKKRKALAERRKPLNIDHLEADKLKNKISEMFKWLSQLEEEKYDFEIGQPRQKYDVAQYRSRVADYMQKTSRQKSVGKKSVKTG